MANKVTVKIYGQEYTIAGDESEETIRKIAEYVDEKMHIISRVAGESGQGNIGILSAINIAEEYFDAQAKVDELTKAKTKLENDSKYYQKMWEDAKQNYAKYQESMKNMQSMHEEENSKVEELQTKCNEYENAFFDLQMENIRLKSELDKLKQ
ncbi:MAG: cell division protein ZapA [Clostridia bacterium]|nr:cell division protein ZapA [Clostridia bacterium]MDO5303727.1 cell division protein ZapA [Clostridia bacterium]